MQEPIMLLPFSRYNAGAMGVWFEQQAKNGLVFKKGFAYFAIFEKKQPVDYVYHVSKKYKSVYEKDWNYIGRHFDHHIYVKTRANPDSVPFSQTKLSTAEEFLRIFAMVLLFGIALAFLYQIIQAKDTVQRVISIFVLFPIVVEIVDWGLHQLPIKRGKSFGKIGKIKNIITLFLVAGGIVAMVIHFIYVTVMLYNA